MVGVGHPLSRFTKCLALLVFTSSGVFADPAPRETLAELGRKAEIKKVWKQAVGKRTVPAWIRNLKGVAAPMETVQHENVTYHVGRICKTHECGHQFLIVALSSDQQQAWGLRVAVQDRPEAIETPSRYAKETWIGRPSDGVKALLRRELAKDPNWK